MVAVAYYVVVGLTYETKFTFQHSVRTGSLGPNIITTFSKLTPSAMISSPTVRLEETDGCSSDADGAGGASTVWRVRRTVKVA